MKKAKSIYKKYIVPFWIIIGIGFVFLLWWIISLLINSSLFPGPQIVIPDLFYLLSLSSTYEAVGGTLLRLLISFAFAFLFGAILGIFGGLYRWFRLFIKPLVTVLETIPTAAVIVILIILLKPIYAPIIIVFLVLFPIIYESFVSGFTNIDPAIMDSLRLYGAHKPKAIFKVMIPLSKPYILLAIASSLGLGMKVSIMSEVLSGSSSLPGLGRLIYINAMVDLNMSNVLAISIIAILLIGIIDIAIHYAKKYLKKLS
jgi:NitT/TauT family transport system permease protein